MRDEAMSSIALVIFFVDWTVLIRRTDTIRCCAPMGGRDLSRLTLVIVRFSTSDASSASATGSFTTSGLPADVVNCCLNVDTAFSSSGRPSRRSRSVVSRIEASTALWSRLR